MRLLSPLTHGATRALSELRELAVQILRWCGIRAAARSSPVPLSSDEPQADGENNEADKYRYFYQQVDCVHGFVAIQVGIHLTRRFRSAEAFTVEPGSIEAANASLSGREHRAGILDPTRASLRLLGRGNPVNPISARVWRDVRPQRPRLRGGCESLPQGRWNPGLRFVCRRRDLEGDDITCIRTRRFTQLPIYFEPVTFLAVRLECGLEPKAIDRAFDGGHAPGGELRTGILWQGKKSPGAGLCGLRRAKEFCCETDLGSGFGHCWLVSVTESDHPMAGPGVILLSQLFSYPVRVSPPARLPRSRLESLPTQGSLHGIPIQEPCRAFANLRATAI